MTDQKVEKEKISYILSDIAVLEVLLKNLTDDIPTETAYGYQLALNHSINNEQQCVQIVVDATLIRSDNSDKLAQMKVGYRFDIKNFEFLELEGGSLPKNVANSLNGLCISTTRGVFYSELRGTNLHDKIMPIINIDDFQKTE